MAGMQVVLFRHGIAEDREAFTGSPDSERPLTNKGVRRTCEAAAGLLRILPDVDVIGTSPYLRARQTADAIAGVWADARRTPARDTVDALQPGGDRPEICRWLAARPGGDTAVLVGHEPDLSDLTAWFTAGSPDGFARFKKAGAGLIGFAAAPERGRGELLWLIPPAILRRLAEG